VFTVELGLVDGKVFTRDLGIKTPTMVAIFIRGRFVLPETIPRSRSMRLTNGLGRFCSSERSYPFGTGIANLETRE
jgi:hypothetical protein